MGTIPQATHYTVGILYELEVALQELQALRLIGGRVTRKQRALADQVATMGKNLISNKKHCGYVFNQPLKLRTDPDFLATMLNCWIECVYEALDSGESAYYAMGVGKQRVQSRAVNYSKLEARQIPTVSLTPSDEDPEPHEPAALTQRGFLEAELGLRDGQAVIAQVWETLQHELSDTNRDIIEYTTGIDGGERMTDAQCAEVLSAVEGVEYTPNAIKKRRRSALKRLRTSPNAELLTTVMAANEDIHPSVMNEMHLRIDSPDPILVEVPHAQKALPVRTRSMTAAERNRMNPRIGH